MNPLPNATLGNAVVAADASGDVSVAGSISGPDPMTALDVYASGLAR